ncbi:MAG TPA: hypothetical protein PKA58_26950, partial [Polyangium sp.]|nr:hypothetical protein [Polyangium sp.]
MTTAFARTGVSRADLARLVHEMPRDRVASAALSLGFERMREPDPTISIDWIDPDELGLFDTPPSAPKGDGLSAPVDTAKRSTECLPLWRQETMHFKPEPSEEDVGDKPSGEFTDDDLKSDGRSLFATPKPTSLAPWARLWPHLRTALQSTMPSREPDVAAWLRSVTRGDPLPRFPCLPRRTWANRISLWIDRSPRLVPFWSDQTEVCRRLQALCHRNGLDVRLLDAQTLSSSRRIRGDLLAGFRPDATVPVLVLGDLGGFGTDTDRALWRRTGRRLVREGVRLSALMPSLAGQCTPTMLKLWNAIPWERGRQRRAGYAPAERKQRVERLLTLVSPAALVQPGLLRAIRLLLPPTWADASTEADAWVHPDVRASSGTAWILRPEAAAKWRAKFAEIDPVWQSRVSQLIGSWHKDSPRELLRAESLVWHGLLADRPTAHETPGDLKDALAFAQRLTRRLGKPGVGSDVAIHHYGRSLLAGLPDKVIDESPLLRNLRDKLEGSPPTRYWAIRQFGSELEFHSAERGAEWPSYVSGPGSPVALFVAAGSRVTVVQGANETPLRLRDGLSLSVDADEPFVLHTDRSTVKLVAWRFQDEPDWVAAGRDRYGLWADAKIAG